jgi:hypothetical protein
VVGQFDRFVRDAGDLAIDERVGALLGRGEMQVREQHLALAHPAVLLGDRLLDLEDELGAAPHVVRAVEDGGTGHRVVRVRDRGAGSGAGLHEHLMSGSGELEHAGRGDGHPELVVLDFGGNANLHQPAPSFPQR